MCRDVHQGVKNDDAFQGRTKREDATRLIVLILFTNEKITYLGVVDHKLNLLLRAGSIEGNGHCTNAPGSKVTLDILH